MSCERETERDMLQSNALLCVCKQLERIQNEKKLKNLVVQLK